MSKAWPPGFKLAALRMLDKGLPARDVRARLMEMYNGADVGESTLRKWLKTRYESPVLVEHPESGRDAYHSALLQPTAPSRTEAERAVLDAAAAIHPRALKRPLSYVGDWEEFCEAELARRGLK